MTMTVRIACAVVALLAGFALGGAAAADDGRDRYTQCIEQIHRDGGRVFIDGKAHSAGEFTLAELRALNLPAHCPNLGTNDLLYPRR